MASERIHPDAAIGAVRLTVSDLERSLDFYTRILGMGVLSREGGEARLGNDGAALLELRGDADAPPRPRRTTGLFHFAVLVPSRRDLARVLAHLAEERWPLTGASDHLVSEAAYLHDPDGIGIEIYRDRPREEWTVGEEGVAKATLPMDLDGVLGELTEEEPPWEAIAEGTRMGHVHLNVADLADSERFYCDTLGFDATARNYPGALFVSAGGYHHHVGLNIWNGAGAPPPPDGAIGLDRYEIVVPDDAELDRIRGQVEAAGFDVGNDGGHIVTRDPAGNGLLLRTT